MDDSAHSVPRERAHSPIVSPTRHSSMKQKQPSDFEREDLESASSRSKQVGSKVGRPQSAAAAAGWQSVKTSQEQLSNIYKFLDEVDSTSNIESQSDYSRSPRRAATEPKQQQRSSSSSRKHQQQQQQKPLNNKSEAGMFDWERTENEHGNDGASSITSHHQASGSSESGVASRRGQRGYENVKSKLMAMTLELEDKTHTVKLLQGARSKDKATFQKQLQVKDSR